jgi:hypothetical protein
MGYEMGRKRSMQGDEEYIQILAGKLEQKGQFWEILAYF